MSEITIEPLTDIVTLTPNAVKQVKFLMQKQM